MAGYLFEREFRTSTSESYTIELGEDEIGRIDLHYGSSSAYGTLSVVESLTEEEIRTLVGGRTTREAHDELLVIEQGARALPHDADQIRLQLAMRGPGIS